MHKPARTGCDITGSPLEFLNSREVAAITGLSQAYLDRMRMERSPDSPPWFRVGRRCLYPRNQLQSWAEARMASVSGGAI